MGTESAPVRCERSSPSSSFTAWPSYFWHLRHTPKRCETLRNPAPRSMHSFPCFHLLDSCSWSPVRRLWVFQSGSSFVGFDGTCPRAVADGSDETSEGYPPLAWGGTNSVHHSGDHPPESTPVSGWVVNPGIATGSGVGVEHSAGNTDPRVSAYGKTTRVYEMRKRHARTENETCVSAPRNRCGPVVRSPQCRRPGNLLP